MGTTLIGALLLAGGLTLRHAHAAGDDPEAEAAPVQPLITPQPDDLPAAVPPSPVAAPVAAPPVITVRELQTPMMALQKQLTALASQSGGRVAISLRELGGNTPRSWSYNGGAVFAAGSTYKLPALMAEANGISSGTLDSSAVICYLPEDYEDGWFDDYVPGACFSRNTLAARAGQQSDNTAGHMLVRDVGGTDAVNAFARGLGATGSGFFIPNTTTADDLASLWVAEATGQVGGAPAQQWLYPLLTHTAYETGVPAGVPAGTTVVHKVGFIDETANDAALVSGPRGAYVLVVCTEGLGEEAGFGLIARVSQAVWQYEAARP